MNLKLCFIDRLGFFAKPAWTSIKSKRPHAEIWCRRLNFRQKPLLAYKGKTKPAYNY